MKPILSSAALALLLLALGCGGSAGPDSGDSADDLDTPPAPTVVTFFTRYEYSTQSDMRLHAVTVQGGEKSIASEACPSGSIGKYEVTDADWTRGSLSFSVRYYTRVSQGTYPADLTGSIATSVLTRGACNAFEIVVSNPTSSTATPSVNATAPQVSGGGSDAGVPNTGPAAYHTGFSNSYMRYRIADNGDRCDWTIQYSNASIDVTLSSTAQGRASGTVRVRGTRTATPFGTQPGSTTTCQPSTESIDASATFETVLPSVDWRLTVRPREIFEMDGSMVSRAQLGGYVRVINDDLTGRSGGSTLDMPLTFDIVP